MSKKIYLFVTPFFPNPKWHSGIYSYDFVKSLRENSDFDVRVFLPGEGEDYDFKDVHVYRFKTRNLPTGFFPLLFARWNQRSFLRKLASIGIDTKDVVVCHSNMAQFGVYSLAVKERNPHCLSVLHHHDLAPFGMYLGRARHFLFHRLLNYRAFRRMHEAMDLHLFVSEKARESMRLFPKTDWSVYADYRKMGKGLGWFRSVRLKDSMVLHNGVDPAKFFKGIRPEHEGFVIGCVADFIDVKDHLSLIKAVESLRVRIPSIKLRFLGVSGFGPYLAKSRRYVAERGLADIVTFEPNRPHDELAEFYREIDLFAMPSFFEGFGCVYTEAWACGTPFIACSGQGIEDVLRDDGKGRWLCRPKDFRDLGAKILCYYERREPQNLKAPVFIPEIMGDYIMRLSRLLLKMRGECANDECTRYL